MTEETPEILVVDDDAVNASLMAELCEGFGYRTRVVGGGAEALEAVTERRPDLILLDLAMPQVDGFEVLQRLKSDERSADIPVVIVTAMSDLDAKVRGIELGADDFLTKPFKLFDLQARIRAALQVRMVQHRLQRAQAALLAQGGTDPLTGAGVFAHLHAHLDYEVTRSRRYGRPLSLLVVAIHDYDGLRETLGREGLEQLLPRIADGIRNAIRGIDQIFRTNEEEFVVLLPETDAEGATVVAGRIAASIPALEEAAVRPQVSVGVATFPHPEIRSGEQLLRAASDARHLAQHEGPGAIARHG